MKYSILIVFLSLLYTSNCGPKHHELQGYNFDRYKTDFQKAYDDDSMHNYRKTIFESNLAAIHQHNADETQTWKKGVNHFTDMTHEEFSARLGRAKFPGSAQRNERMLSDVENDLTFRQLPSSWDWRDHGIISPVKDQGHCGSCWAFAATEAIESNTALNEQTTDVPILSPQQLVSCAANPLQCGGAGGCDGSIECLGMNYVHLMGFVSEETYPYTSGSDGVTGECNYNATLMKTIVTVSGYIQLPVNKEPELLSSLYHRGPNTLSVDATNWSQYETGIFDGCYFNQSINTNHAVFLAGYDRESLYVRNSWSSAWGEDGYIRLKRTEECGYDENPSYGSACVGDGQVNVTTCGMCGVLSDSSYPLHARFIE